LATTPATKTRTIVAAAALAVAGVLLSRLIAHCALGDVPHVQDEQAYLLQARTMAMGRLFADVALPRAAFNMWFVDDRWARFGIFPPGWPAVLAIGVKLHATFWVNPLLHGVATWFVGLAARRMGGARAQILAAALYSLSPQAVLLASSLMSHAFVAACAAVVIYVGGEIIAGNTKRSMFWLGGGALGIAFATRPLCGAALAMGLGAMVFYAIRVGRARARDVILIAVPVAAATALLCAYNAALTGSPLRFPQTAYFDGHLPPVDIPFFHYHVGCNDLGFGADRGCDSGGAAAHDLANGLSNTGDNLWAWILLAGGGPLFVAAAAYGVWITSEQSRIARALRLVPVVAVIALYALYWYAGTSYGARFYHAALPGVIVLAAFGLRSIRVRAVAGVTLAVWLGWNAFALAKAADELTGTYWGTDARFGRLVDSWHSDDALVMVAFAREPAAQRPLWWTTRLVKGGTWLDAQRANGALALNAPNLDGRVVFAKFHPALVAELRARFAGRPMWLYVAHDRVEDDRLVEYDTVAATIDDSPPPKDNFDGYTVDDDAWPRHHF
jgi:4-amino-4-deoxy-L-arabinose transferase-like glycosyltransferase